MKLKFKTQAYQTHAVDSVVDCFVHQPMHDGLTYRIDPGQRSQASAFDNEGFKNADLAISEAKVLENIQAVQRRQNLPVAESLTEFTTYDKKGNRGPVKAAYKKDALAATRIHLDVEMETGTGKTYCYIKTIFEMNKRYGWSKFIIMVPSIAIREGVYKSLQITADHFTESYGKKARFFIYNSKRLHELESFSSDAGINVMVMNIQAFNARGKDNRRIYDELDDFQSRKPIDVIAANRPILILDEPQKMEGKATMEALPQFKPLMILRYSATHRTQHNRIHRLDALDAYNQKLVKKIAVRGIQTRGLAGTNAYLYLEGIDISRQAPIARIEMEIRLKSGEIKRQLRRLQFRDDLFAESGELDQYRDGFTISQIDATTDTVEFTNGLVLRAGEANGDVSESDIRRIQIRETIKAHLDREKQLFSQGIKVLSLFFIDEVVKYRDYDQPDEKGEYARIFEEEYQLLKNEYLSELAIDNEAYRQYLDGIDAASTHNGYFSIDKKTNRLKDPKVGARSVDSDDVDAYDLILKDKERLLSFQEPTRFIFSHSALREGWDNPNVFVMCMLKHSDNTISRRQEVGRGLRLSVDQHGDRMDNLAVVHTINVLTVIASESYKDFVAGLQQEIGDTLSARPRQATEAYFTGKQLLTEEGPIDVTAAMAKQIYRYLVKNDYTDNDDQITDDYHNAKKQGTLADLPDDLKPYADQVFDLIDSVFSDAQLPKIEDGRKPKTNPLNANFDKKEFQALWQRINRKAVYRVEFDSDELVQKCIASLNQALRVTPLQYTVQKGIQQDGLTDEQLRKGEGFKVEETATEYGNSIHSLVRYDLLGKVAANAQLTRQTTARVLQGIKEAVFKQFQQNPEHFIAEASRLITEQKAAMVIERLAYDEVDERYDVDIFMASQTGQDFSRATQKLKNHVYDYAITDSDVERRFVKELDTSTEVVVYAKLPRGFLIPTPVGDYNPDWAISFREGNVKHIYFVAETKGSMSSMKLREIEKTKIECARKFFAEISQQVTGDKVKYDVVTDYAKLMDVVGP
ncbi:type III restriction-modification system endonuclease [Vreelandella aquamarina]|jgi:type III restriction enzyme|uniref:type III restriction-modification system endonuclease n=1 Tax=Halomonadaceae TaxID=28256 RepID=UPI000E9E7152|nr:MULTISPECIES: DEAD/DEAH box helicase family protein [Halomonas]HBN61519.1 restriction endonuclease subunit R [Halomonas sp.]MCC4289614.1 DEAD/DEAH box helicase family protein [Halomonas axialensis]MCD1652291.1 DEAD/DEAH box helicase family protein [Halomonas axialensis]MCD2088419.1 DEAD/DEAH box helicase family protein [Halomonas meridiana]MCF2914273.1 DEAD/DEAH box helicase family protein [Halomonas sp. Cn5-12]|tara:strand:- start:1045 stop:4140 length:3096 start_codon:yes stop_codon:yes gene_type:complete